MILQSMSLTNWCLKQMDQNAEVMHKFARGTVIKPLQFVTVSNLFCLVKFTSHYSVSYTMCLRKTILM